ncbi:cupin-like domain-containing protein [Aurantiacibacter marinus]|uniref:Transcriptional regulator n=2 Tax=Aurantiacibacter marinus TaxID=874156 RepID=A0A0H0XSI7_9SPHN|nr:cupin-like domain-containing protein [Aurantiacibacter marinus]KLI63280.1 transcriptional regulator [Aurantiacibacter marinus]
MTRSLQGRSLRERRVFSACARSDFKASYPEGPHKLDHDLVSNPMLELDALAMLGEALPPESVEYNLGDVPIGVDGKPAGNGLSIGQTIREIGTSNSWAVLKNIEQKKPYAALLEELLDELRPIIEARTGKMMRTQGFIFVSSPDAVTPYHFDPEHNILLQLRGRKSMMVFPAGDARFAPDELHEAYHTGGARELKWDDSFAGEGETMRLYGGDAIYVPVMAPHYVKNGSEVSISLSITWRSEWSFAEADARAFNAMLRGAGIMPNAPKRWPARNSLKANAMRIARRIPGLA